MSWTRGRSFFHADLGWVYTLYRNGKKVGYIKQGWTLKNLAQSIISGIALYGASRGRR